LAALAKPVAAKRSNCHSPKRKRRADDWLSRGLAGGPRRGGEELSAPSRHRGRSRYSRDDGPRSGGRRQVVEYENVAKALAMARPEPLSCARDSGSIRAVKESYGAALLYFTGSKAHNIALRGLANEHGWKLNEYGLFGEDRAIAG
jgi:hypothetical protein